MAEPEGNAGLIGKVGLEGTMDFGSAASAQGGKISNGMIINTSGTGIGLVKMLALAGFGVIIWRLMR
ncbi:MAG: hypothetical protein IJX20_03865 [Alphaproteobacteria bacterium]|nr:hypothetical protein [Alphaproteobacteria bacterium]